MQVAKIFTEDQYNIAKPLEDQINEYLEANSKAKVYSASFSTYYSICLVREALVIFDVDDYRTRPVTWDDYDIIGEL